MQVILWFALIVLLVIFMMPWFKKNLDMRVTVPKRWVTKERNIFEKVMIYYSIFLTAFSLGLICYSIVYYLGDFITIISFFKKVWVASLLSIIYPMLYKKSQLWSALVVAFSVIISNFSTEDVDTHRLVYSIIVGLFTFFFVIAVVYPLFMQEYSRKRKAKKGIWKDLYYRKPNIVLDYNDEFELSRCIEKLYNSFLEKHKKIKDINLIEFVTLRKEKIDNWYKKASFSMKMFFGAFLFYNISMLSSFKYSYNIICIIEIVIILFLVYIIKKKDYTYLKIIGIRFFFDDWGYCIYTNKKVEFVSVSQTINLTKYHNYIKSFLDILAILRFAQEKDRDKETNLVGYLSRDMVEIADVIIKDKNWIELLPVWLVTYLQFETKKTISPYNKLFLSDSIKNKTEKADLSIALQSILADYYRRLPDIKDKWNLKCFIDSICDE